MEQLQVHTSPSLTSFSSLLFSLVLLSSLQGSAWSGCSRGGGSPDNGGCARVGGGEEGLPHGQVDPSPPITAQGRVATSIIVNISLLLSLSLLLLLLLLFI